LKSWKGGKEGPWQGREIPEGTTTGKRVDLATVSLKGNPDLRRENGEKVSNNGIVLNRGTRSPAFQIKKGSLKKVPF